MVKKIQNPPLPVYLASLGTPLTKPLRKVNISAYYKGGVHTMWWLSRHLIYSHNRQYQFLKTRYIIQYYRKTFQ